MSADDSRLLGARREDAGQRVIVEQLKAAGAIIIRTANPSE